MATTKRKKRLIGIGLALLLVLGGVAYYGLVLSDPPWFDLDGGGDTALAGSGAAGEAITATSESGPAEVEVAVTAVMPKELDDGTPERSFQGSGVLDLEASAAAVTYAMGEVPNSAGFLGHVGGDLDVVYSGSQFAASFPEMEAVLEEGAEWMSYDLDVLTNAHVVQQGVGQLREIAMSDPRLAIAFLNGAEDLGDGGSSGAESVTTEIDIEAAIESVDDQALVDVMELLRDRFQVSTFEADVAFDDDGRIDSVGYSFAYPSGLGEGDVELQVELDVTSFDGESVEVPDEGETMIYADYMQV